jgi:hypothetical protein
MKLVTGQPLTVEYLFGRLSERKPGSEKVRL